jgi:hypothetical protein
MSYVSIKCVGVHGIALGDWSDALRDQRFERRPFVVRAARCEWFSRGGR